MTYTVLCHLGPEHLKIGILSDRPAFFSRERDPSLSLVSVRGRTGGDVRKEFPSRHFYARELPAKEGLERQAILFRYRPLVSLETLGSVKTQSL